MTTDKLDVVFAKQTMSLFGKTGDNGVEGTAGMAEKQEVC